MDTTTGKTSMDFSGIWHSNLSSTTIIADVYVKMLIRSFVTKYISDGNPGTHNIITVCIDWLYSLVTFMTIHHALNFIFFSTPCSYYSLFIILLWCFDLYHLTWASLLCLLDWTASTRSMWRSAWLQANAPKSRSSLLSTTRWKWSMPLSWWKVEGESSYLLLCLLLFPCSTHHFIALSSSNSLNLQLLVSCQQKLVTLAFFMYKTIPDKIYISLKYILFSFFTILNCHF